MQKRTVTVVVRAGGSARKRGAKLACQPHARLDLQLADRNELGIDVPRWIENDLRRANDTLDTSRRACRGNRA